MEKQKTFHEPTPRDDAKKVVSEILKRVDQLIRNGDLDYAMVEITKAKAVDPRNVYILALEERISLVKTNFTYPEEKQAHDKSDPSPATESISKTKPEIPQVPASPKPTVDISSPDPPLSATTLTSLQLSPADAAQPQEKQGEHIFDRSANLESYRQALVHAWFDGALTENEERQLNELRIVYGITNAEHEQIEKNVKHQCYRNALLLRHLSDNSTPASNSYTDLQCTFQISDGEHLYIQTQLMNTIQSKQRDKILIIDDDTRLLGLIASTLEDNGFDVTALSTSDEAYVLLRTFTPDLILCDINLETSTMGGFSFFEKIQGMKNVQGIPFVFLTGLTDEALVRTGKELGVDDYLMKPISEQALVSTLHGKLKRFKQLNVTMAAPLSTMTAA